MTLRNVLRPTARNAFLVSADQLPKPPEVIGSGKGRDGSGIFSEASISNMQRTTHKSSEGARERPSNDAVKDGNQVTIGSDPIVRLDGAGDSCNPREVSAALCSQSQKSELRELLPPHILRV